MSLAPADASLLAALKRHWGYREFLPNQADAIQAICAGRDVVVVLPTGGGKSICYQLPAIVHGRALVVSPLIALMQDQVAALRQHGVAAGFLNSSLSGPEASEVIGLWRTGKLSLLYVAPERLLIPSFLAFLAANPPTFFAVDEAHCISHWGHDFRPEYRNLRLLRERFPDTPICAFTATATRQVRGDIVEQLTLRDPVMIVGDFDRPNLHYRAERRSHRNEQVEEVLRAHAGKSGIVYCISRKDSESLAEYLCRRRFKVAAYHAGLEHEVRRRVQHAFSSEELDAVVATVAFGMGIDRSNVRFVIHAALPSSVEHYQQETGRAGRDGLPAECVLLYSAADKMKWQSIFEKDDTIPPDVLESKLQKLNEMMSFAYLRSCRHKYLVRYFGQDWPKPACGNCDNCSDHSGPVMAESTVVAQKILSCVARLKESYGAGYVTRTLHGDSEQLQPVHCGLSTFGLLREHTLQQIRTWIDDCMGEGLLARSTGEFPVLGLTPEGWSVLRGQRTARLSPAVGRDRASRVQAKEKRIRQHKQRADLQLDAAEEARFDRLRKARMQLAKARRVPAYVILHDAALLRIVRACPSTLDELGEIPGIGEAKIRTFGPAILAALAESTD